MTKTDFLAAVIREASGYAEEAEHQDGNEYFKTFTSVDEALEDFGIYLTTLYERKNNGTQDRERTEETDESDGEGN